jgi:predicted dehydrogenase
MKVALVGTGQIAQRHLRAFPRIEDVRVVGHVATDQTKADAAAVAWGGRGYTSIQDLLASETVDAVWITVPPDQHGPIEYALLEAEIPFLVEKPLSSDRATAESIGEVIARKNALVGVGYNWRAMDTLPAVRAEISRNPVRMVVGAFYVNTPATSWWTQQSRSGGQIVEQATHLIDLTRTLVGEGTVLAAHAAHFDRPVYPDADIAGVSAALLRFEPNIVGVFSATCILARGASVNLQLFCENLLITISRKGVTYDDGETQRTESSTVDSYEAQNRAFLAAVRSGDKTLIYSTYEDALRTHRLCHDILAHGLLPGA